MSTILEWIFGRSNEQEEKPSRDARLNELCTPSTPYAERPAGDPQYCGEAVVEYDSEFSLLCWA
jgi:hypothetical protein